MKFSMDSRVGGATFNDSSDYYEFAMGPMITILPSRDEAIISYRANTGESESLTMTTVLSCEEAKDHARAILNTLGE